MASWRRPVGVVDTAVGKGELDERLVALGEAGDRARALDGAAVELTRRLAGLSPLTSALAENYAERVARPLPDVGFDAATMLVVRGYAAHLAVEADPSRYGAADIPVIGSLPPARHGRAPTDLLTRVVRATRRGFEHYRAVDAEVWEGFVACSAQRVHALATASETAFAAPDVVDGLVRVGWILRQVDLHYGQQPEQSTS